MRFASRSWRSKALTERTDPRPCCATATISLWRLRTSRVASLTAFLKRITKSSRNGVTPMAMSAKSQLSQNMMPSMPTMVMMSTTIDSVADDAKSCTVDTSLVSVDSSEPVWCVA